ncbi:ABC transporter [Gordonibacter sp. An230]|uniref:ABC transporter ATP-binding protein n=1 Tax=Gordonibacter sp. An230 TaxID=1965592 RepID=UPI000B38963C|nr:ABC transporter ATP-binding protein [Gordonibacter sp. An230]OUO91036.1 ABC transporter [Gordonibacter sp. An230]
MKEAGKQPGWLSRAFAAAGSERFLLVAAIVLAALSQIALFLPYVAIYFVVSDAIHVYPNFADLDSARVMTYGFIAVGGAVGNIVLYMAALLCSHAAAFDTEYRLRLSVVSHIARIPLGRFLSIGSGRVGKIMDANVNKVSEFIAHSLPDLAASTMAPVCLLAVLIIFDWRLGLAALACVVAGYAVQMSSAFNNRMRDVMPRYQQATEKMANATVEYVRGMPVVKTFGQTASSFTRLSDSVKEYTGVAIDVALFWQNLMPAFTAIVNNAWLFVLPVGIVIATGVDDWLTFALNLIFYLLFVPSIAAVLNKLMYISQDSANLVSNLDAVEAVTGISSLPEPAEGCSKIPADASIEFDKVSFRYEEDGHLALDEVSFSVPSGSTCAIVGPSGSGKSTVASLMARFWDVSSGSVRVGGVDVREIASDTLMSQMSLVFQDVSLFKASLLDNIRMARPDATSEEVMAAAKAAQADEFIRALPQGYETVYGSDGVHLSGGEKQRVSIARAILADRPIVVLDEATAFADPENEHLIQKAFAELMAGKTVVMIAHRLSTVVGADQILVIDDGRIMERGRHEDLLAAKGAYARLWDLYTRAVTWKVSSARKEVLDA